jgi:membrane associated rhomboid family serine protease
MIPLKDENPTRTAPWLIFVIIGINALVFLGQVSMGLQESALRFGLIPAELVHDAGRVYSGPQMGLPPGGQVRNFEPSWATLFTSMFMHGSWFHLIFNMWFLWIFGNNIEDSMGRFKFILFYLACGVLAAGAQILTDPASAIPMIGASGAVAGVLGGYIVTFPGSRIHTLIIFFLIMKVTVPAWVILGFWFLGQVISGLGALGLQQAGGVAFMAHVGGFIAGMVLVRVFGIERHAPRRDTSRPDFMDWRR